MPYRELYIFVEGPDDARFMRSVITPLLADRYALIQTPVRYACMPNQRVRSILSAARNRPADLLFFSDMDSSPCVTERLGVLKKAYGLDAAAAAVVVKAEIESWYLAGLDTATCKEWGLRECADTEAVDKEAFCRLRPAEFISPSEFKIAALERFDMDVAKRRNASFKRFAAIVGI